MAQIFEIPLTATPQRFKITLGGVDYWMTFTFKNVNEGGWVLDVEDASGMPMVSGIPLVAGIDLLGQYQYLGFNGRLHVQTTSDPDATPTFENLGAASKLYWVIG